MAPKAKVNAKETRGRKWSLAELKLFATVLVDDKNDFALSLETLALKKSANLHIFENIKKEFDTRLKLETETVQEKSIDTSASKLRAKYKWMKDKWRNYTDRAKSGTGKAAKNEPEWFHIIDPIFSETNAKLKLASEANDLLSSESEGDSEGPQLSDVEIDESKVTMLSNERKRKSSVDSSVSSITSTDGTELNIDLSHSESDEEYYDRYD